MTVCSNSNENKEATKESSSIQQHVDMDAKNKISFANPMQRTKCLIQYIRLRKQRAEKELTKRREIKKQKKDAQVRLQQARDKIRDDSEEIKKLDIRFEVFFKIL